MRAVRRAGGSLVFAEVATPKPGPGEVRVRVAVAGVCRTDIFAAEGRIKTVDPVTLGHELAGVVDANGRGAKARPKARVTVMPSLPCGACASCRSGSFCGHRRMLGVDRDGAFADFVIVPAASIIEVPDTLDVRLAAYTEPVAAALAVANAPIERGQRGVIIGANRIATLTARVLAAKGFTDVTIVPLEKMAAIEEDSLDFAIETWPSADVLAGLVRALKPCGVLVLKSRPPETSAIDVHAIVRKELTLVGALYGSFDEAVALLANGLAVDDLLGAVHPLKAYASVFAEARGSEARKAFLAPSLEG